MIVALLVAANLFAGVDFDELRFDPGPCYANEPVQVHGGAAQYESATLGSTINVSVDKVFRGNLGGKAVAVVLVTCEMPGTFGNSARLFELDRGHASYLLDIGSAYKLAADSPFVDGPWFYATFSHGKLYTDRWDTEHRCKRNADWIADTYELRSGKPVRVYEVHHHRAGAERVTSEC